ncbi:hypothetical protein [Natronomonas sp. EA1]|uniref:hypothetical protein n=1 Tax=Natronomonas sp. EA1 TaxID=3421655 RepID=UPI003EBADB0A
MVYVTRGLVTALLEFAGEADPESVALALATTPASDLPEADLDPEASVFTDFYLPDAGRSVNAVFGMDLGRPNTDGRFVSHPQGKLELVQTDDFAAVIFVAIPPYDESSLAAFGRSGRRLPLEVLDIEPPEARLDY